MCDLVAIVKAKYGKIAIKYYMPQCIVYGTQNTRNKNGPFKRQGDR